MLQTSSMANPGDFSYSVKQQADIVRIVGEYVKLKKSGAQNFSGLCPFHSEKSPSFSVHATRQYFYCFGCHEKGDVFNFVQKMEHITFPESVRLVAQKLGIPLPKVTFSSPEEAREAKTRHVLVDLHEKATAFFQEQLRRPDGAPAREYLAGRGLDAAALEKFRIGFAPESGFLLRDFLKGAAEEEFLRESGLFSWKDREADRPQPQRPQEATAGTQAKPAPAALYSKFRNRVMFPICNDQGKVIAFTGRTLSTDDKAGPKYLNSPETPIYQKSRVLFNLHMAKEAMRQLDYVILVEGQMDCISVYNAGFHNVIASSGTAFTEIQVKLLSRYTKKIVVNFDPDTAGVNAAEKSLALLIAEDFDVRVLTLEQGFDPDLYIRSKGVDAYSTALRGSQRYFDYLIERARAQFSPRTPEGKVKALNFLLPHIQRVPSRIVRDELASEIAQKLQIDSAVLRQELKHVASSRSGATVSAPKQSSLIDAERVLIRALTSGEQYNVAYEDENHEHHVYSPSEQARFTLVNENLHRGLSTESLLNELLKAEGQDPMSLPLPEEQHRVLATVLMDEQEAITPELLHSAIEALRRRHLEQRQRELKSMIGDAERRNDQPELLRLLQEKLELDRQLRLVAQEI
jgi:DNA primase